MPFALLAEADVLGWIVIAAVAVLFILCVVYGVLRKFNQSSWLGWQIAFIFPCTIVLDIIGFHGVQGFFLAIAIYFAWTAVILGCGAMLRYYMMRRLRPANKFCRVMNRILGGLTAIVNIAMGLAVCGGMALLILEALPGLSSYFGGVFASSVWGIARAHALDLFIVATVTLAARCGYRVGFGRAFSILLLLLLTLGCVLLGLYFPVGVRFSGKALATLMAGTMHKLRPAVAFFVSYAICAFLVFLVAFAIVILLAVLMNFCVRKCRSVTAVAVIDGILLSVVSFAILLALWCGLFGVTAMLSGDALSSLLPQASGILGGLGDLFAPAADFFCSSPFAAILFELNPLALL